MGEFLKNAKEIKTKILANNRDNKKVVSYVKHRTA